MKLEDRIILRTIDNKVEVRPKADQINSWIEIGDISHHLTDEGITAWNNGEEIYWHHFDIIGNMKNLSKLAQAKF